MLLLRDNFAQIKRLHRFAGEASLSPEGTATLIQPFIDKYKALRLTMSRENSTQVSPHAQHRAIVASALQAGLMVQRQRIKGIAFHIQYQRTLARHAADFNYRGFTECSAIYLGEIQGAASSMGDSVWGRVDVAWAAGRDPQVIFEIDSTVKPASLWKLRQAQVAHKYWIYFGPDVWKFKTYLRAQDAAGEIHPIILPQAWKP